MIEREAYAFTCENIGLHEIKGAEDNFLIRTAHLICNPWGLKNTTDIDHKIPWCSAWVNLSVVVACIRRNPKAARLMLEARRLPQELIKDCFKIAGVPYDRMQDVDTQKEIVVPTFSAAAKTWAEWGIKSVAPGSARRGDICVITRDGGYHVAFLDEDSLGKVFITLLGGNQKDSVCSANWFARARLISIVRAED